MPPEINPVGKQVVTIDSARQRKIEAVFTAFFARRTILANERLRAKIDFSKPQQVDCRLFADWVNKKGAVFRGPRLRLAKMGEMPLAVVCWKRDRRQFSEFSDDYLRHSWVCFNELAEERFSPSSHLAKGSGRTFLT